MDERQNTGVLMSDIFRTLSVPADDAPLARQIADTLGGAGAQGMWETPLGPTADGPTTWYVSSGYIPEAFAYMVPCTYWAMDENGNWVETSRDLGNPIAVYQGCVAAGLSVTQDEIDGLFARADVNDQDPWVAFSRMGVTIVQPPEPI
jgi:hypothetical protein